jgi:branched-chain amino acid aminotransferase
MSECSGILYFFNDEIKSVRDFDQKLLYKGKSIYEVFKIRKNIPLFIEKHFERLENSAKIEKVELFISFEKIKEYIFKLIALNKADNVPLKIVFSYQNDYFGQVQNIFLCFLLENTDPTQEEYIKGVPVISSQIERKNPNAKVVNYIQRGLINEMIKTKKVNESILIDKFGNITEGSRSNFFAIKENIIYTSPLTSVLPGVTRKNVIEVCNSNNIIVKESYIKYSEIENYDAFFLTGTSRKILPINKIDSYNFQVDNTLLRDLMKKFDEYIDKYLKQNTTLNNQNTNE